MEVRLPRSAALNDDVASEPRRRGHQKD